MNSRLALRRVHMTAGVVAFLTPRHSPIAGMTALAHTITPSGRARAAFVLGAAIALTGFVPAAAQETGDAPQGRAYARAVCAECHAVLPGEAISPTTAAPPFEAIAKTPGMTAMALSVHLQTSHRTMPNLVIESDDRRSVIAYILSLKN